MRGAAHTALRAWLKKLDPADHFSEAETAALCRAADFIRPIQPREVLVHEGRPLGAAVLITEGFAYRGKLLGSGDRQIISLLVPGDLCDGAAAILDQMDHSIVSLTAGRAAFIPYPVLREIGAVSARVAHALQWSQAAEEAITREWIVNVGARRGDARLAHLLCEIAWRLDAVGLAPNHAFSLPMTQQDLGDATALTVVHVNRVLKRFRDNNLIHRGRGALAILDPPGLERAGDFSPAYLHLRARTTSSKGGAEHRMAG